MENASSPNTKNKEPVVKVIAKSATRWANGNTAPITHIRGAPALNDGSGFFVRRIGCKRFGERKGRFCRAIQFQGVTKPGCRNGTANWAECSGGAGRSHLKLEGASLAVNPRCLLIRKSGEWRLN